MPPLPAAAGPAARRSALDTLESPTPEGTETRAAFDKAIGAVLVRPDHIVGWRCVEQPEDPAAALSRTMASILGVAR